MPALAPLLRHLANPAPTAAETRALVALAEASPGAWPLVARQAQDGGCAGLVYRSLEKAGLLGLVPDEVRAPLRAAYGATLADNLRRLAAADRLHAAWREAGLTPLLLKGAALVETHYRDPGVRPMRDLDYLVRPGELAPAEEVLARHGYRRRRTPGRERSEDAYYQRSYVAGRERVELHTTLCDERRYGLDAATLWRDARPVPWRGSTALVLDEAHHLAYVALHAALHCFLLPLGCLVDQSLLLRRAADPAALAARAASVARSWRAGTAAALAFTLARDLAAAPFAAHLLEGLRPSAARAAYLRACFHGDRMPAFRWGQDLRRAQALTLLPLMDGGRAPYLAHYGRLRAADWLQRHDAARR